MSRIVVVTGGARSGKSAFAERYVQSISAENVAYIATAAVGDEEMQQRVHRHRARRPAIWTTYELVRDAAPVLAGLHSEAVLFDCLTLYTSNMLLAVDLPVDREDRCQYIFRDIDAVLTAARICPAVVVFVTNEVGSGIVPDNALAREYRDIAGWVNQRAAAAADEVYLVTAGLAIEMKTLARRI